MAIVSSIAQENKEHKTLNIYKNEKTISATKSVTLKDGFFVPRDSEVHIFTAPDFMESVLSAWLPSKNQNYVRTRLFKMPDVNPGNIDSARNTREVNQTVQYIDGLGRGLQANTVQGSPTFRDIVQPVAYDDFGRERFKYLSYSAPLTTSNGSFKPGAIADQTSFYNDPVAAGAIDIPVIQNAAFSETRFEASPLNRIMEMGAPGVAWQLSQGHTKKIDHGTNLAGEVKFWQLVAGGAESTKTYEVNRLRKTITRDENTPATQKVGSIEEFKDFEGRLILKRSWETEARDVSTYYVYDNFNNLRYVIPPAVGQNNFSEVNEVFDQYIFGYRYDGRKRMIRKKIPGKGWESMVYNNLDQLVLSQDSVQKTEGKWLFNKYDGLGRLILTGICISTENASLLESKVNGAARLWENRTAGGIGYSNNAFPTNITYYHSINYYDDYSFPDNTFGLPDGSLSQLGTAGTKGMLTGNRTTVLGTGTMLLTVNYYDTDRRLVQTKSENHLNGNDVISNSYNFAGELEKSVRINTVAGVKTTISNRYLYDHMGRKRATYELINENPLNEVMLSKLDYNELGQLQEKSLHSTNKGGSFLQNTTYTYNERNWLKKSTSAQFGMELTYQDGTNPQFNGNIARQRWGTGVDYTKKFVYTYDLLNRLLKADSAGMKEVLTYDVMGNILSLNRDDAGLSNYSYLGNRLDQISGASLATGKYEYDVNGNVKLDGRNGLRITYNHLNLPVTLSKTGLEVTYAYDASGRKLQKTSNGTVRNYIDGIEYNGNVIDIIHHEEGIVRNNSNGAFSYEYNLKDHLGNVRYTFYKNPSGGLERIQSDDYYAFGLRKSANSPASLNNKYLYNGKEIQDELGGQYDYGARFYDPVIGRWNVVDQLAEMYAVTSPYNYTLNNPVRFIDPDGMRVEDGPNYLASTHTDRNGKVIAVYDDGDLGVYRHENNEDGKAPTKANIDKRHERSTSAGGQKMGETEFWDEFTTNDAKKKPIGRIRFGESWDKIIDTYNDMANEQDLYLTGQQSRNRRRFDIKEADFLAEDGVMTGKLLDGKYASARSAGNYLAGLNGRTGTIQGQRISRITYMKLAGALQQRKYSFWNALRIVTFGTSFGSAPFYGEEEYSGRMILNGWNSNRK
ncbi:RHS repeat-associated core domain-containing protein [Pedobacter steynii]|uniref:RHS repeat-associated core domain-containing protein n=1 Tax=Pedobacter steynii TaxID=430522 RepID=A0A1G9U3Z2_9SPHI|nr:DUF6443 domain-containing protein [Pedobacter steynii]NQX40647.1 RHS repeat-associated core domain-containing protein [Pedobacter steynii]SDM54608.1 RHS repeat-associated core domain-containing protein [Pedobacter steynii]